MIDLTTASKALKTVYLDVVTNQLNLEANPLLAKIKQSSESIYGKQLRKVTMFGMNGGIAAGEETGALPTPGQTNFAEYVTDLRNLYGQIEISDKAIRASQSSSGAFVNLLNNEMESLIKSSSFNLGRMLYGDGNGFMCRVVAHTANTSTFTVTSVKPLMEGMHIRFYNMGSDDFESSLVTIKSINRTTKTVTVSANIAKAITSEDYETMVVCQSSVYGDIHGLEYFINTTSSIYGIDINYNSWLLSYKNTNVGNINDIAMQAGIDSVDEQTGSVIDFITTSSAVKRKYQEYLATYRRNIDVMELAGGCKALSFNGIPLISDRFCPDDVMYMLNTKDFTFYQLCDWEWLEGDDGKIIKQKDGYATYTATLVKYAELLCERPSCRKISLMIKPQNTVKKSRKNHNMQGYDNTR